MSKRGIILLSSVAAVLLIAAAVVGIVFATRSGPPVSAPTTPTTGPTPSASTHTPTPPTSAEPTPTAPSASPTPSADLPVADPACETITTAQFRSMTAGNGWIAWSTADQQIGPHPFDGFPGGAPSGQIICRWGKGPTVPTDNVVDLGWAPLDGAGIATAQTYLKGRGYVPSTTDAGTLLTQPQYHDVYLFTAKDVRWAPQAYLIGFVAAPGGE